MTQLSIGQAAKLTGRSKSTISRAIKNGRLSASRDGDRYLIDPAELTRVFGVATVAQPVSQNDPQPEGTPSPAALELEVRMLREMLDRERETVEDLRERLTRAQALLEDHRAPPKRRWWLW